MSATADTFQPRGGGVLLALVGVVGFLVLFSGAVSMDMAEYQVAEAPAASETAPTAQPVQPVAQAAAVTAAEMTAAEIQAELDWAHQFDAAVDTAPVAENIPQLQISQHAWEKHPDIAEAVSAYGSGQFLCAELLRSVSTNRYLLRVRFAQFKSELGIITTLSGIGRTAFRAEARYWDKVVVDYEYQPVLQWGQCAQWAQ